jgi:hypothetical protein
MVVLNSKTHAKHENFVHLVGDMDRTTPDVSENPKSYVESLHGVFRGVGMAVETAEKACESGTSNCAGYRDRVFSIIPGRN